MEASDLTATQEEIATVARFLVWRGSQHSPCAEPEATYRLWISDCGFRIFQSALRDPQSAIKTGGESGIRTHGTLNRFTAFPMLPVQPLLHLSMKNYQKNRNGGEGGIRTHGTRKGTTIFETARFNHSRTSPHFSISLQGKLHFFRFSRKKSCKSFRHSSANTPDWVSI